MFYQGYIYKCYIINKPVFVKFFFIINKQIIHLAIRFMVNLPTITLLWKLRSYTCIYTIKCFITSSFRSLFYPNKEALEQIIITLLIFLDIINSFHNLIKIKMTKKMFTTRKLHPLWFKSKKIINSTFLEKSAYWLFFLKFAEFCFSLLLLYKTFGWIWSSRCKSVGSSIRLWYGICFTWIWVLLLLWLL